MTWRIKPDGEGQGLIINLIGTKSARAAVNSFIWPCQYVAV
jgi:hypothetical protein